MLFSPIGQPAGKPVSLRARNLPRNLTRPVASPKTSDLASVKPYGTDDDFTVADLLREAGVLASL